MKDTKPVSYQNQYTKYADKVKDSNWKVNNVKFYINRAKALHDKSKIQDCLKAAEGYVDEKTYKYVMNPLNAKTKDLKGFAGEIRDVDIVSPIKDKQIGEFQELPDPFVAKVVGVNVIEKKNAWVVEKIKPRMEQKIKELIQNNESEINIQKEHEEILKNFVDVEGENAQNLLELFKEHSKSEELYNEAFYYWWCTEQAFSYREATEQDIEKVILNPEECYPVCNKFQYAKDGEAFLRHYKISYSDFINKYKDYIDEAQLKQLEKLIDRFLSTGTTSVESKIIDNEFNLLFESTNDSTERDRRIPMTYNNDELILNHVVWRSKVPIQLLTYLDSVEEVDYKFVSEDYTLDEVNGDIELSTVWVDQIWEGYNLEDTNIYFKIQPHSLQLLDGNGKAPLPYNGIIGIYPSTTLNPLPLKLQPLQALYRIMTLQQERTIATTLNDILVLPQSVLQDYNGMSMEERLYWIKADNKLIYNDEDVDPNILNTIKMLNSSVGKFDQAMEGLKAGIRNLAMDVANMNEQRYGNISQYAGKASTEQAILKVSTGTTPIFARFYKFMEADYNIDVNAVNATWKGEKTGIVKTKGDVKSISIDMDTLNINEIGVFIKSSPGERRKLEGAQQFLFAAAQNDKPEMAIAAIDADTMSEMRNIVTTFKKEEEELQRSMEEYKTNLQQQLEEKARRDLAEARQFERDNLLIKEEGDTKREIIKANAKNPTFDSNETTNDFDKLMESNRKYEIENRKLDIKREEIAANERIAKVNKNKHDK